MHESGTDEKPLLTVDKIDAADTNIDRIVIPRCRADYTLKEARKFIDDILTVLKRLDDLANLIPLYRTTKQLNRIFTSCPQLRIPLAKYLNECHFPALATKLIKRLNNIGVFTSDDSDTEFATSLAVAGISRLLNLNFGHPPYLENINSKNVYFLIKASLSILHNIVKVPGNRDMGQYTEGRDALINILKFKGEESLRCIASLCLAHTLNQTDIEVVFNYETGQPDLLQLLLGHLYSANASTRRKHHGFPVSVIMNALSVFSVNKPVQPLLLRTNVETFSKSIRPQSIPPISCVKFLLKLTETFASPVSTEEAEKEAYAATRIIYHLMFNHEIRNEQKVMESINHIRDLSLNPTVINKPDKALSRLLESLLWQAAQPPLPTKFVKYKLPEPSYCGPIVMSYAPINRPAVTYFVDQLRAASLPVWNDTENKAIDQNSAQQTCLSALAGTVVDHKGWLQSLNQATLMIVCLSDAYRISPGCRSEVEYFISANTESHPKMLIYIILPPKFIPNGWIAELPGISEALDFTHKRTFIATLQQLVTLAGKLYGIVVADGPLESVTYNSQEGQKGYITVEDLSGLKSSSIFLTSSESDEPKHSGITQTTEQMVSKGSPRNGAASALKNHTSSSTTLTPLQSSESEALSQHYDDYEPVVSVPSTDLSAHKQPEHPEIDVESKRCQLPVTTRLSTENMTEPTILDIPKMDYPADVYDKNSEVLQKSNIPKVTVDERSMNSAIKNGLSESAIEASNKTSPVKHSAKSRDQNQKCENHLRTNVTESQSVEMQTFEERSQSAATKEVILSKKTNDLTFNSGRSAPTDTTKSEICASSKTSRTSDVLNSVQKPCTLPSIVRTGPDNSQTSRTGEKKSPITYGSSGTNHHMKEHVRKVEMSLKDQECEASSKRNENTLPSILRQNEPTNEEHRLKADQTEESKSTLKPLSLISTAIVDLSNAEPINRETTYDIHTESNKDILPNIVAAGTRPVYKSNPGSEIVLEDSRERKATALSPKITPEGTLRLGGSPETSRTISSLKPIHLGENRIKTARNTSVQTVSLLDHVKSIPTMTSISSQIFAESNGQKELPSSLFQTQFVRDADNSKHGITSHEDIVLPYVRSWTVEQVTEWLSKKCLQHLSTKLCGGMDGVILSQLICLRYWAPEYFAKSIRSELGLGFIEGLRLVEAMEELTKRNHANR
ncbi:hypothetical protein EG68_10972 [Paragonimus skrjabini miyazakii]|uniref:TIR domain-containing protein n=1 Tax=Paragonimus skrjabini miyazakii TaxID=59628 RepID=A0A8S9YAF4_9TREM|nr:hypothetical protein EG68_10972 [Paragonimus skrjabini miyazakii]